MDLGAEFSDLKEFVHLTNQRRTTFANAKPVLDSQSRTTVTQLGADRNSPSLQAFKSRINSGFRSVRACGVCRTPIEESLNIVY